MIQVSMDGTNLEEELVIPLSEDNTEPPGRFELGSCGLHVVHGAFRSAQDKTKCSRSYLYMKTL
ncbi:hypothetical protein OUZ56_003176 [Daphnia magna]|uniref:Uncharacterized protein n=1 Tax=Daphnia magna TaxID=35525 RepID=A0ABR0A7Z4_9CRUS|nr:hypothetical protein OUZ56_003176 [Daphnia magna]